ncbi:MAG: DNA-processing protein DprA, partial [Acidobacteriaceae bacterium]
MMNSSLSLNTQAALLFTAPLMAGEGATASPELFTHGEWKRLLLQLRGLDRRPADLLSGCDWFPELGTAISVERVQRLLARGFQLSQALDRWLARAIWVVGCDDVDYPPRLAARLNDNAPAVLYGCGDASLLETGGLAVVGSRNTSDSLLAYTLDIGHLAGRSGTTLISGGARGIDQAAMRGALEAGGKVSGILSDSLERAALSRTNREWLRDGRLVLVSSYDPSAGFNVGHAMNRNKFVYAFSDAALVVSSDHEKGGTWTGATEQLDKLRLVPIYVRSTGGSEAGLDALMGKGALPWPNPQTPESLSALIEAALESHTGAGDEVQPALSPAELPFHVVRGLLTQFLAAPKKEIDIASELRVSKAQAKVWLQQLV